MPFSYQRTVHFRDTDAAGVVYFANLLAICHEAYEASLAAAAVDPGKFFYPIETAVPITHTEADFLKPLRCGDRLEVLLTPTLLSDSEFEIQYELAQAGSQKLAGRALTRHVCIHITTRKRQPLTAELTQWLQQWSAPAAD
jgi:1,4-dihydroxy-2-naphthoyl-CoA hydrolase